MTFFRNYEHRNSTFSSHTQFPKIYQDSLPSYSSSLASDSSLQPSMHQSQQILSPTLSFDLESPTTLSLPSPGATSCSLDGPLEGGAMSPPANVSGRRDSTSSEAPALQGRVNVLHRVSRWFDYGKQGFF